MRYYVIGQDGSKYGPADLQALNQWIAEGRLQAWMYVEGEDGGRIVASSLPGLNFLPPSVTAANPSSAPGADFGAQPGNQANPYEGYYYRPGFGGDQGFNPALFPKFNWGAFIFTWIWGLNHRQPITLIALGLYIFSMILGGFSGGFRDVGFGSPIVLIMNIAQLGLAIWIGMNGYKWAWESGRFASVEDCRRCQATWGWWGLGIVTLCCAVQVAAGLMIGAALQ